MGLDCYLFAKKSSDSEPEEIWYGRKENEIHGWMQRKSGIDADDFNCVDFPLTIKLLQELKEDAFCDNLPQTRGFFFGDANDKEDIQRTVQELIKVATYHILEGYEVYYHSWW